MFNKCKRRWTLFWGFKQGAKLGLWAAATSEDFLLCKMLTFLSSRRFWSAALWGNVWNIFISLHWYEIPTAPSLDAVSWSIDSTNWNTMAQSSGGFCVNVGHRHLLCIHGLIRLEVFALLAVHHAHRELISFEAAGVRHADLTVWICVQITASGEEL